MRFLLAFLSAPALLATTSGCDLLEFGCTADLRNSVSITVVDADGAPVPDAVVTFTRNDDAEQTAPCTNSASGMGCDRWSAGEEQSGTFVITATDPMGRAGVTVVNVDKDECHVITESVTITVQPTVEG